MFRDFTWVMVSTMQHALDASRALRHIASPKSRNIWVTLLVLAGLAAPCLAARPTQQPKTRPVSYERWGFKIDVPLTSVRQALPGEGAVELWELFRFGDLVFSVKLGKTPPETLTATAIEQAIQAQSAAASSLGGAKRWELESPGGDLFKGLTGPLPPDETSPDAPYLKRSLGNREAYRSLCMAALGDESSPVVTLSVTGPKTRSAEIENLAKFFAFGFSRAGGKPHPTPMTSGVVKPPKPAGPPRLNKGDIELVGRVESIDGENMSLNMIVDRIRMPQTGYIQLDPPRRKVVFYKKPLPDGIAADSSIAVIGFNTGVGNPITVDVVAPVAAPGNL